MFLTVRRLTKGYQKQVVYGGSKMKRGDREAKGGGTEKGVKTGRGSGRKVGSA